jgi:tetratricopeptide (TPR) repeat protein
MPVSPPVRMTLSGSPRPGLLAVSRSSGAASVVAMLLVCVALAPAVGPLVAEAETLAPSVAGAKAVLPSAAAPAHAAIPAELDRASRLLVGGDTDGAIREYEALLARAPSDPMAPMACVSLSNLLLESRGDTTAALAWCKRVISDYPGSAWAPVAAAQRARQLSARGDWVEAGDAWLVALRFQPSIIASRARRAEIAGTAADCYEKAGAGDRLRTACRGILAGSPPPELAAAALWRLGKAYEAAGAADSAAACYAHIIRDFPSVPEFSKAMEKRPLVEPRVTIDWRPCEIFLRGSAVLARNDYAAGLANADSVLAATRDPALVECAEYRRLTCETWVSGDLVGGVKGLRAFLAKYPEGLRAATAKQTLDDRWQPLADMQQGALDAADDAEAQAALGDTFVRSRLYKTGLEALEKAAALAPDDAEVIFTLGHGYAVAGRIAEAEKTFTRCVELAPDDSERMNLIGYTFLGVGKATESLPYFERYVTLAPDDPNAHDSYGEGLLAAGRAADSAREYEKALALRPGFDNAVFMLGRVYRQLGDTEKARAAYRDFLKLQPDGDRAVEARAALAEMEKETKP